MCSFCYRLGIVDYILFTLFYVVQFFSPREVTVSPFGKQNTTSSINYYSLTVSDSLMYCTTPR